MMHRSYSDEDLTQAVASCTSVRQVLLHLGLKIGGGSSTLASRNIKLLNLDTSHFHLNRIGRPRKIKSFTCKYCNQIVIFQTGDHVRVYCSTTCLYEGRRKSIKAALSSPAVRRTISEAQKKSWSENRDKRLEAISSPEVRERTLAGIRKAAASPSLRKKRSLIATEQWYSNPDKREKFMAAAKRNRRQRALSGVSPYKPIVPYYSDAKGVVMVRSMWERDYALWLDRNLIEWEYEPTRVVMSSGNYTPDFFVRSSFGDCYIELHRVDNPIPGDRKIEKMEMARPHLEYPLILVSEAGIRAIRLQLRRKR